MFNLINVVCEVHYTYYENPNEIVFKVLHNKHNNKDVPWPALFRSGLRGKIHLSEKELLQSDYFHRQNSVYLSHNLWTCDCDPRETGVFIHTKSTPICINCKQTVQNATPRLKYFYEVFPYEVRDYKFDEKEAFDDLMAHHQAKNTKTKSKYLH